MTLLQKIQLLKDAFDRRHDFEGATESELEHRNIIVQGRIEMIERQAKELLFSDELAKALA